MSNASTVYIIDLYDKYNKSDKVAFTFRINDRWWAIKEVSLEWGLPILNSIEADDPANFHIYDTLEEAKEYARTIKQLEGTKF